MARARRRGARTRPRPGPPSPGSAASASSSGPGERGDHAAPPRATGRASSRAGPPRSARLPASQARSDCDTGGSPTRSTTSGRCSAANAWHAQEHVVVGHHVRAVVRPAAHTRRRVGQHRPAARGGQARDRLGHGPRTRSPHTITPRRAPVQAARQVARRRARRRAGVSSVHGRPPGRPSQSAASSGSLTGRERLAEREVEVHGARAAADGGGHRAAGERAVVDGGRAAGLVAAHLDEPLGGAAVEVELVDRLPGAHVAQLRRPVGGQHQQRHGRLARLGHRRVEVGRRGAGRAGDRDRRLARPARCRAPRSRPSARRSPTRTRSPRARRAPG